MSVAEAQATGHEMSLCLALALAACPIALWVGNLAAAAHYAECCSTIRDSMSLPLWSECSAFSDVSRSWSLCVQRCGDLDTGLRLLRAGSDEPRRAEHQVSFLDRSELSWQKPWPTPGGPPRGSRSWKQGSSDSEAGWLTPELLRLKGELLLSQSAPAVAETPEALFRQALDEARQQGALSWELRAATSLARLLRDQGRHADAIACLRPIYDRFSEGFGTADLIAAKQLLDDLDAGRR